MDRQNNDAAIETGCPRSNADALALTLTNILSICGTCHTYSAAQLVHNHITKLSLFFYFFVYFARIRCLPSCCSALVLATHARAALKESNFLAIVVYFVSAAVCSTKLLIFLQFWYFFLLFFLYTLFIFPIVCEFGAKWVVIEALLRTCVCVCALVNTLLNALE